MLACEVSYFSKNKTGEEICGDTLKMKRGKDRVVVSISDGLGSGVKASILSTLTASIATTMVYNNLPIEEVFKSILETLPVCKVRGISYATLCTMLFDSKTSECSIIEYEFPVVLYFKNAENIELKKTEKNIEGKKVFISKFKVEKGDSLFIMTDGISQAGMGTELFPFGFGIENVRKEIRNLLLNKVNHAQIAKHLVNLSKKLDERSKGDDALVAAIRFREYQVVNLFVGPPENRERDKEAVESFMKLPGKKIVCGGTTGQIFEKILKKNVKIDLFTLKEESPPVGYMEGIDLVTEGIVTLTHVFRYLDGQQKEIGYGAKKIVEFLETADEVNFFVGRAINPAHQNPLFSHDISLKFRLIKDISDILKKQGKIVDLKYF
ncbi:MAG: hypothetical protein PWQ20_1724 [Thermotogaceae bacterium]|jgi:hypothetical protein|nr:hypothetical protein [Thermotogaceae bacterium]MDN5338654.1 hypothetical protein [Thermotogaceae bacterium]